MSIHYSQSKESVYESPVLDHTSMGAKPISRNVFIQAGKATDARYRESLQYSALLAKSPFSFEMLVELGDFLRELIAPAVATPPATQPNMRLPPAWLRYLINA